MPGIERNIAAGLKRAAGDGNIAAVGGFAGCADAQVVTGADAAALRRGLAGFGFGFGGAAAEGEVNPDGCAAVALRGVSQTRTCSRLNRGQSRFDRLQRFNPAVIRLFRLIRRLYGGIQRAAYRSAQGERQPALLLLGFAQLRVGVLRGAYRNGLTGQVDIFLRDHIAAVQRQVFTGAQGDIAPGAAQVLPLCNWLWLSVLCFRDCVPMVNPMPPEPISPDFFSSRRWVSC